MLFFGKDDENEEQLLLTKELVQSQLKVKKPALSITSWSPLTTHLLDAGGACSWNVMDNVIPVPSNFVGCLKKEWDESKLGSKFPPGNTNGDSRASDIMELTTNKFGAEDKADETSENTDTVLTGNKGDKSIFIPLEFLQTENFSKDLPCLALVLRTIQNTIEQQLTEYFTFDFGLTTVQVEIYPGDGKSGYIRDFSKSIIGKKKSGHSKRMKDIVAATYFATPEDWDLLQHKGCVRIISNSTDGAKKTKTQQQYFDIPPYSNRLFIYRCDSNAGVKHQLLPSNRPRMSINVWYFGYNKKEESQMERDFLFIDCKTGSVGSIAKDTLVDAGVIRINDTRTSVCPGGYSVVEAATKFDEKTKLINMIKDCEKLGIGMGRPKAKAKGFSGEEAKLVAAKWGVALKKRVKNKEGEELLFLDPNMNTIGEISRSKCVSSSILTLKQGSSDNDEIIMEAANDPTTRAELLDIVKELMYTLEFDKHVEQNS